VSQRACANDAQVAEVRRVLGSIIGAALVTGLFAGPLAANGSEATLKQVGTYEYLTQPDFTGLATVG
jgi:uncharacterized membrane protein (DUF441 family)